MTIPEFIIATCKIFLFVFWLKRCAHISHNSDWTSEPSKLIQIMAWNDLFDFNLILLLVSDYIFHQYYTISKMLLTYYFQYDLCFIYSVYFVKLDFNRYKFISNVCVRFNIWHVFVYLWDEYLNGDTSVWLWLSHQMYYQVKSPELWWWWKMFPGLRLVSRSKSCALISCYIQLAWPCWASWVILK